MYAVWIQEHTKHRDVSDNQVRILGANKSTAEITIRIQDTRLKPVDKWGPSKQVIRQEIRPQDGHRLLYQDFILDDISIHKLCLFYVLEKSKVISG